MRKLIKNKRVTIEELTLKDVIESLAYYNIEHCRFPSNYINDYFKDTKYKLPELKGLALDDKKLILIDKDSADEVRKETIIHELIHTKHYRLGDLRENIEDIVEAETNITYKKLYNL